MKVPHGCVGIDIAAWPASGGASAGWFVLGSEGSSLEGRIRCFLSTVYPLRTCTKPPDCYGPWRLSWHLDILQWAHRWTKRKGSLLLHCLVAISLYVWKQEQVTTHHQIAEQRVPFLLSIWLANTFIFCINCLDPHSDIGSVFAKRHNHMVNVAHSELEQRCPQCCCLLATLIVKWWLKTYTPRQSSPSQSRALS